MLLMQCNPARYQRLDEFAARCYSLRLRARLYIKYRDRRTPGSPLTPLIMDRC